MGSWKYGSYRYWACKLVILRQDKLWSNTNRRKTSDRRSRGRSDSLLRCDSLCVIPFWLEMWGGGVLGDLAGSQHFAVMHWWTFTLVRSNLDIQSWFLQNAWLSRISAITLSSPPCQVLFRSSKLLILFEQKPCFAAPVIERYVCQLFPTDPQANA